MPGPRPQVCTFPDVFLQQARIAVRRRTVLVQEAQRFRLVLLIHEQPTLSNAEAGSRAGLSERQVRRWRQRWVAADFTVDDREGRGRKTTFSPNGSSVGGRCRLSECGRNRRALEPTVTGRSDAASESIARRADEQEYRVADTR